jgi:SAM-dependent methyltransferase
VWARLDQLFPAGAAVLELAGGTGEDARHLAERGVRVVTTDQSPGMLAVARAKTAGLPVTLAPLDLAALEATPPVIAAHAPYDGVLSDFGGLNGLPQHRALATWLAPLVRPGGRLVLVIMGRYCAWEITWHLLHLEPRRAFRRLNPRGATSQAGGVDFTVYYPATAALRRDFAPHFRLARAWPLGLWLPPTYLEPLTRRRWFPFRLAAALEQGAAGPLLADHTVYEFVREP